MANLSSTGPGKGAVSSGFEQSLGDGVSGRDGTRQDIGELIVKLDKAEDELVNSPGELAFAEYRDKVRALLAKLLDEAYRINITKDRRREYETVRVVNENLSHLYKTVINRNKEVQELVQIIGTIRGILMDIAV